MGKQVWVRDVTKAWTRDRNNSLLSLKSHGHEKMYEVMLQTVNLPLHPCGP